ncbi:MAG: isoprenyl transferase [Methylocystaceae bacterium]
MDGNGRWAQRRFLPRFMGHRSGMEALRKIVTACREIGIEYLTVYAFSTENWKRPENEVSYLMNLLVEYVGRELAELHTQGVKICTAGDLRGLPEVCQQEIKNSCQITSNNDEMTFTIAINYGSRNEILKAVKSIAVEIKNGSLTDINDIDETFFADHLYTRGMPDPDLVIRTAGEQRISNFLLWQIAYAEIYVTEVLWPDFDREELLLAIADYQKRVRKYGGLSETGAE